MSIEQQTFTLAAICQCASIVQSIARSGDVNNDMFATLLKSITNTSPSTPLDVYENSYHNLSLGLKVILDHLGNKNASKDPELTRYIVSLIALERRLTKKKKVMNELASRITQVERQLQHFDITDETIVASFASIYSDLISPLSSKIQISGNPEILKQPHNQHKIRAMLLAGVRAAVLWRQVGGKRRNILFARSKLLACATKLLNS